jgi:mRNA-degrading endonuclease YafQ of YafQ-DinJ toxin-antitoxin module
MKFIRLASFKDDFETLPLQIQEQAKEKFKLFVQNPTFPFHPSLRIKKMKGLEDIWEGHVTGAYVFTFTQEHDEETGELIFLFRRIGTHSIYDNP